MFSGIIEEFATVVAIEKDRDNIDFTLRCSFVDELGIDQSVAHNGVCLTVVKIENGTYTVTAMKETLERTNLGLLKVGDWTDTLYKDTWTRRRDALPWRTPTVRHTLPLNIKKTAKWHAMAISRWIRVR